MKKILLAILFLLLLYSVSNAATLYAKTAGGNWSAATTWSTVDASGADNSGPPAATDDVIFDAGSTGTVTVDTTTCVAKTVTCQNAGNSITFTAAEILTVSGNVTFISGMTLSGTGTLKINAAATLTSGGVTFPGALTFSYNGTIALGDNWTVTGLVTNSTATCTLNGYQLTTNGGLTAAATMQGTTVITIGGTGGVVAISPWFSNSLTFNCTTATVSGLLYLYGAGQTITWIAGTITTTGSTLFLNNYPNVILNTDGIIWDNIRFNSNSTTYTLASNLTCTGTLSLANLPVTLSGAYNISCGTLVVDMVNSGVGNLTLVAGQTLTVTTTLYINGSNSTTVTIKSSIASTKTNIIYNGTVANCKVFAATFTDVAYSGSTVTNLDNWCGGTLTRTVNITNRTSADFGAHDVFGGVI